MSECWLTDAVDLFAGPGGLDLGALAVGIDPLGIELDEAACATREAAGLRTEQADVAELDPNDYGPVTVLTGSPPCQAWSAAGKRKGELDKRLVYKAANRVAEGDDFDDLTAQCEDPRSMLVVEPLRWAIALRPRLMAFEQVPPVLGLWRYFAELLREHDYSVWAGVLEAERYGVPQTRKRAILMAASEGFAHPPAPTHQRYVKGEVPRAEEGLLPWVSMAEALGWGMTARPSVTVASGGEKRRGVKPLGGGSGSDRTLAGERERGEWQGKLDAAPGAEDPEHVQGRMSVNTGRDWKPGGSRDDAQQFDPEEQPAPAVDGKGRWRIGFPRANDREDGAEYRERDYRDQDEPAFTVTEKARSAEMRLVQRQPGQRHRAGARRARLDGRLRPQRSSHRVGQRHPREGGTPRRR